MSKPLIGVTFDSDDSGAYYSKFPWYVLRQNYCSSVSMAGGVPFPLTHELPLIDDYLSMIDGLVITGGHFDVPPHLFGEAAVHETVITKDGRSAFEFELTQKALERGIPILGICGGQQLMNVVLGGTLVQHIPDEFETAIPHEQPNPRNEPSHSIVIEAGTLLHRIIGRDTLHVNSAHHQAVKKVSSAMCVNATAPDGVIEGIEHVDHPFCLGVQWHPEFLISEGDRNIYKAFVSHAQI